MDFEELNSIIRAEYSELRAKMKLEEEKELILFQHDLENPVLVFEKGNLRVMSNSTDAYYGSGVIIIPITDGDLLDAQEAGGEQVAFEGQRIDYTFRDEPPAEWPEWRRQLLHEVIHQYQDEKYGRTFEKSDCEEWCQSITTVANMLDWSPRRVEALIKGFDLV